MSRVHRLTRLVLWFITLQIAHSFPAKVLQPEPAPLDGYFNKSLDGPSIDILDASFLSKRSPLLDAAIAKGTRLLCRVQNPALLNDQSPATSSDMLTRDGWTKSLEQIDPSIFPVLGPYFVQEGVENDPEDCEGVRWEHTESSKNSQGQDVPATEGRYLNIFNTNVGFILGYNNFGPAWMVRDKENAMLPDIRAWSDVAFLEWQTQAEENGHDVQGLKYVFRYEVVNPDTVITVEEAVGRLGRRPWPGYFFPMSDERGRAILGTPNGVGVAYLLATHKEQLGDKTIESVQVWWQLTRIYLMRVYAIYIAFKIGPVASSSGPSTAE